MTIPEQIVQEVLLVHGEEPYNPQKAHEYYLRTRQLKGKTSGSAPSVAGKRPAGKQIAHPVLKRTKPTMTAAQRKAEIERRTAALQSRLEALRKVLAELVKQAKSRSGVKTPTKAAALAGGKSPGGGKSDAKLTAKQKADAAKRSKEYYEKNKNMTPEQKTKELEGQIKDVSEKIAKMRAKLAEAKKATPTSKPVPVGAGSKHK